MIVFCPPGGGKKSQSGGQDFVIYLLECTEKIMKKSSSRLFLAHSGSGQETTFYLTVALWKQYREKSDRGICVNLKVKVR